MELKLVYGIGIVIAVILITLVLTYIFLLREKPKKEPVKETPKAPPKKRELKIPSVVIKGKKKKGGLDIPPGIPRTTETIKIMAEEDIGLVVNVIKQWLRERR